MPSGCIHQTGDERSSRNPLGSSTGVAGCRCGFEILERHMRDVALGRKQASEKDADAIPYLASGLIFELETIQGLGASLGQAARHEQEEKPGYDERAWDDWLRWTPPGDPGFPIPREIYEGE